VSTATVTGQYRFAATGTARAGTPRAVDRPVAPRLRLTKRGRGVLTTLAAAPLVIGALVFALNGGMATATLDGSGTDFQYVTVDTGQSLWEVAETIAPNADPRDVIAEIMQLNQLESADVMAGQQLAIPAKYVP
jgi:hypothetical protein